jgi:DnaJ-class molecular chaperone
MDCPDCDGFGRVTVTTPDARGSFERECASCAGTGHAPPWLVPVPDPIGRR